MAARTGFGHPEPCSLSRQPKLHKKGQIHPSTPSSPMHAIRTGFFFIPRPTYRASA